MSNVPIDVLPTVDSPIVIDGKKGFIRSVSPDSEHGIPVAAEGGVLWSNLSGDEKPGNEVVYVENVQK